MVWKMRVSVEHESGGGAGGAANRLGWNAMPFARDDLDSNCGMGQRGLRRIARSKMGAKGRTLVSIPEEACILAEGDRGLSSRHQRGVGKGCADSVGKWQANALVGSLGGLGQEEAAGWCCGGVVGFVVREVGAGC
jgi:hypothetical protein